jgi:hypothetical protein
MRRRSATGVTELTSANVYNAPRFGKQPAATPQAITAPGVFSSGRDRLVGALCRFNRCRRATHMRATYMHQNCTHMRCAFYADLLVRGESPSHLGIPLHPREPPVGHCGAETGYAEGYAADVPANGLRWR